MHISPATVTLLEYCIDHSRLNKQLHWILFISLYQHQSSNTTEYYSMSSTHYQKRSSYSQLLKAVFMQC